MVYGSGGVPELYGAFASVFFWVVSGSGPRRPSRRALSSGDATLDSLCGVHVPRGPRFRVFGPLLLRRSRAITDPETDPFPSVL